ncbi:hypothetical protein BABINDRAFT_164318 [Babjeviella inositovora NRRL Y-12698]|uniref:Autophagy protein 5 n=1 Tax=Babjeviella inositovora NRRL Y-12698 TaxID=984486 RepID=A0A1E3QY21_9ASCO|nr:uncharacterized protein BABINDRAFT_164318 [Babjeviella inositovora NRRL Y-12698]ODQ82543.1 hypothetical protein BABINDRAFT_164318 [Babjeviella inositovora NRRL Y-12698]
MSCTNLQHKAERASFSPLPSTTNESMSDTKSLITRNIWESFVKVEITLDIPHMVHETYYGTLHRNSYLPLQFSKLYEYFKYCLDETHLSNFDQWWIEHDLIPLKWHLPIGLIYDICLPQRTGTWHLSLRVDKFPADSIIPYQNLEHGTEIWTKAVENIWLNQIKESCFVQCGSAKPIMSLSKEDSTAFWEAVTAHNLDGYKAIEKKITPSLSNIRNIPLKLYIQQANDVIDIEEDIEVIQAPVSPFQSSGASQTMFSALASVIPELFPRHDPPRYTFAVPSIHAAIIPEDAILAELYSVGSYLDGFLHILIEGEKTIDRREEGGEIN